ncbi:uncharacterized protein LOC101846108, partial [Aplysia californica]|uniref:Uncharacterized protein LOC101846108 n=1 Tax=Aplysia californica TaxID=6500 RepID=A0ABM0K9Q1_APLCA
MAFFSRYKSAPQLLNAGDNTYIIVGLRGPSDDEDDDDDEEEEEEEEEVETIHIDTYEISDLDAKRIDTGDVESASASGESAPTSSTLSVNNPMEFSPLSESESSPSVTHRTWKKKRRAPLPPDMSPVLSLRHSYAFDSTGGMRLRTSTDTDSVASENIGLFYQNSTDSEPLLPESARGSNFPGELAGVDNLYSLRSPRIDHLRADNLGDNLSGSSSSERLSGSLPRSPRERSKLKKIQDALRSPQIGRKKSKKEKNDGVKTSPKVRKSKIEEGSKSPRIRKSANFEPMPEMSDWIIACLCDDLEAEQEFEVKRIPDYDRYLSGLLQETDPSHVDYEDLAKAAKRVHSMVKEREDELTDTDNRSAMENVQDRFPHDDLRLRKSNSNSSINNNS